MYFTDSMKRVYLLFDFPWLSVVKIAVGYLDQIFEAIV